MLRRARAAGVNRFLAVSVDRSSSEAAMSLASRRGVRVAVGIHPNRLASNEPLAVPSWLSELARMQGVAALGEVGLDTSAAAPPSVQESFLANCLALARERALPVSLHIVGAHGRALDLIHRSGPQPAVVHYFQGDSSLASAYLAAGCCISIGKPVTRLQNNCLRAAVQSIPLSHLLLETDTYPLPGRSTEPADIVGICATVAGLKGLEPEAVAQATTANYRRLLDCRLPPAILHA